jgi:hypothetical protein
LRALALESLIGREETARRIVRPVAPRTASAPPDLDAATIERLLAADVDLLGEDISYSTREVAVRALWALAGGTIASALVWADRVSSWSGRFWVSAALRRIDERGYDRYRRTREVTAAGLIMLPFLATLVAAPRMRRMTVPAVLALGAWGATAVLGEGVLALPPWPFPLSNVRFLVALAAAVSVWIASRLRSTTQHFLVAPPVAAAVFLACYLLTRRIGFYPPETQSGWIFIVEPAVGLVAAPVAAVVVLLAALGATRGDSGRFERDHGARAGAR